MDRLAVLRGGTHIGAGGLSHGAGNTIAIYGVHLPDPPRIERLLTGATGGQFGAPSWSPDGRSLAWAQGDGVWTGTIARPCSSSPRLTIPGAREPDWGPAGVDPSSPRPARGLAVRTAATIGRRALARRGLKVRVSCPCRASAWPRGGPRDPAPGRQRQPDPATGGRAPRTAVAARARAPRRSSPGHLHPPRAGALALGTLAQAKESEQCTDDSRGACPRPSWPSR
jgi:WD40-like Beta Propeller Repeat